MRRLLFCASLIGMTTLSAQGPVQGWTPDAPLISKMESSIKLGYKNRSGSEYAVTDYARYYFGYTAQGEKMIRGEFLLARGDRRKPGVYVVKSEKDIPVIFDGGCSVVNVVYEVASGRVVSQRCNGLA